MTARRQGPAKRGEGAGVVSSENPLTGKGGKEKGARNMVPGAWRIQSKLLGRDRIQGGALRVDQTEAIERREALADAVGEATGGRAAALHRDCDHHAAGSKRIGRDVDAGAEFIRAVAAAGAGSRQ